MPDISKIEVNGVEYDIKDPVARANSEGAPRDAVLYTEQALTDSQKAQARGNIGAVGTVEETEEVYTYVFTGEEEVVNGVFVKLPEFITKEFLASPFDVVLSTPDGNISARDKFGEEALVTAVASEDPYIAENGIFVTVIAPYDDFDMDGFVLSTGVWVGCTLGAAFHSITSTVPYTKTVQKIDDALIPELCLKSPSGKKFKLTVDDSGTITATEVM